MKYKYTVEVDTGRGVDTFEVEAKSAHDARIIARAGLKEGEELLDIYEE
jgi:capsule polysaccharide export protein KpsE/RkpR